MAYLSLPDGSYYEIPKGMSPQQARTEAYKKYPQAFGISPEVAPKQKEPGIIESGIGGAKKLGSSILTAVESPFGTEAAAQAGLARARALEEKTPSALSLERVKEKYAKDGVLSAAGEVLRQAPSFISEQLPQLGAAFAGGRTGAMLGAPLGPGGAAVMGIAGALTPMALQAYGAGAERRAAEGLPQEPGKTAVSALGQAGLETAAMVFPFGGKLMSRILGIAEKEGAQALMSPAARKLAEERLAVSLAKGTPKGLLAEIPTEVGQQMLERWQANMPLMDDNAIKEYTEAAYGASLFGAPFGGLGRRAQVSQAREQVARGEALEAAEQAKKLREEEAAKKADPTYILGIADNHDAAKAQLAATQQRLKESKPGKDATEGQRDIYEKLKAQYKEQIEEFKPLKKEYDEIKGEARALRTSQLPVRPEALAEAAPAAPQVTPNVQQMMDQYREAQTALVPLETQMQEAAAKGDTATINQLVPLYQQQQAQLQELGAQIEELGGTTKAPELFELEAAKEQKALDKQIKAAQKKLSDAAETGNFAAMPSLATKLDELKAQQTKIEQQREALRVNAIPVGETIPMFPVEAAPQTTEVSKEAEEKKKPVAVAQREKVLEQRQQELAELAKIDTEGFGVDEFGMPNKPFDAYQRNEYKRRLYEKGQEVEQLQNELTNLQKKKPSGITLDLFSDFNLLNTAIQNRDERTIAKMQRAREDADRKATAAAASKLSPREEVYELLKDNINKIVRRERNYDVYDVTINNQRQEVYVYDAVAQEIADLRNTVEKPIGNAKRSMLQIAHDDYAIYEARLAKLEAAKAAKAHADKIATLKSQVGTALRNYTKSVNRIKPYRDKLDAAMAKLYKTTEVATPWQKAAETAALGTSARETSTQVKQAKKIAQGKVKVSEAKVAQELGETMDEYQSFAAPYQKRLQAKVDQFNKFIDTANGRLAKLKETLVNPKEVAAVEKQLDAAIKVRDAIPAEDVIEKDKAEKKVNNLKEHLRVVKTPKEDKYKLAEANLIKIAKERRAELERLKNELTKVVGEKAVALGKQHPDFKTKLAEAKKEYGEIAAGDTNEKIEALQKRIAAMQDVMASDKTTEKQKKTAENQRDIAQKKLTDLQLSQVKSQRTEQETRKIAKLGSMRTSSTESKSATQRRQEAFEAEQSEIKGAAFDYQQRQEAIERTQKARAAKAGKGSAMQAAMTKAAKDKTEALAREGKQSDIQFLAEYDTAAALKQLKEQGKFARGVEVESPDLSSEQIKMLEANNLGGALRSIANDPKASELNRVVAARLAGMLDATDVVIKAKLFAPDGKEVLGEAISTQIQLSRNGGLSQEVLLHEATHAAVERVVQMPDSMLTKEQIIAKRELNALYNSVKNDKSITSSNAKSSLSEFAAEIFSNSNLQEQLRNKKWKLSNAWVGIKSIIMRMLGVKNPETMLGAALQSVDALMIPSSSNIGRVEKPVNRKYSQKDIAALHTGSNSMRQFAEQFGPEIKQKDRTPEDVERIAMQYMSDMENNPKDYVAQTDPTKLDYKSAMTMSDGTLYDEDNLLHFIEADAATLAAVKANSMASMAAEEANAINKARNEALTSLTVYLSSNPDYTLAEQALVAKAAAKYGVTSGKDGVLRVVNISDNNRHPVAVVGRESANAVIGKLREGKSLKDAFIEGVQEVADKNARENRNKNGWQKFDQVIATDAEKAAAGISSVYTQEEINDAFGQTGYDGGTFEDVDALVQQLIDDGLLPDRSSRIAGKNKLQDAAVALNAGAAGTSWCTGASVSTARSQIEKGDFYIYYENGKPQVAVRMNGNNQIGEIRGNTPSQGLTSEQQAIAKQFLQTKKFKGSENFIKETERKAALTDLAAGKKDLSVEDLFNMSGAVYNGELNERSVNKLLDFNQLFGYLSREPSAKVAAEFQKVIKQQITDKYRQGYWVYSSLENGSKTTPDAVQETTMLGETYTLPTNKIKAGQSLTINTGAEHYTGLEYLSRAALFNKAEVTFPRLRYVDEMTVFKGGNRILRLSDGAVINKIEATLDDDVEATILGEVTINNAVLLSRSGTLTLTAPEATAVFETHPDTKQLARTGFDTYFIYLHRKFTEGSAKLNTDALHKVSPSTSGPVASTVEKLFKYMGKTFGETAVKEARKGTEADSLYTQLKKTIANLYDQIGDVDRLLAVGEKQFADMKGFLKEEPIKNPFPTGVGRVIAPNIVRPDEQTLTVTAERPRYAPKNDSVGPHKTKDGWGFRTEQSSSRYGGSFVAQQKSVKDKLLGNVLGLTGRVQFVDQYAALDAAIAKGLDAGVISDLEAEQAGYYLRFGQQANSFATQALTSGPLSLVKEVTKRGMEFVYKSTPGANMTKVAQALEKSGIRNSTELENMFTIYTAGKRAKQVGWNKLSFSNPAAVEQDYNRLMAELKGNDKARTAFEEAAKIYKEYNNGLIDFAVQTGYLPAQKGAELKAIDYVPFYRVQGGELQLMVDKERPVRIANMKDEPMLHELVGDNTQILPIFTSSAQNAFVLTRMALRNQMVKDNAMLLARLGIASKIGVGTGPQGPNTIRYKVKGVDNFALIDSDQYGIPAELIVKGMEGIKTTIPMAIKLMGMPADVLRKFVTRNPAYAIRQAIRDPLTAWFTTGMDGVPVLNSMTELGKMVAGRSPEEAKLMQAGAISSNVMTGDEQDMAKAMRDMSLGRSGWAKLMMKADALAMQGDAATRAVIYKDSLNKGMSEMQALMRTLESMNFSRRGLSPSMQMMSTVIPFFNAQIQGLDVLYRAFKGQMPYNEQLKIRQKLYTRGLLLAAGTLAYAAAMEDDEAYKRAKPEERLGNWFVYTPFSDEPMRVPIPFELGYLFKALPEAVFNMAAKDERADDITKGMGKLLGLSNPFALPAAIKPLTEVVLGKSFFGGDIESMREKTTMMPGERYRDTTTALAKTLGSVTGDVGLTPIKIDYLIRGYTGALGVAIASLANPILNTEVNAVEQPTMKTSKKPFIGGLFQPVEGRGTLDAAYERILEIQQIQGTFDRLVDSGKREEAKAFLDQYRNKLTATSLSSAVQKDLGEFAKLRRMVLDSNKTTAEKDVLLDRIDNAQYKLASKFLSFTGETRPQ